MATIQQNDDQYKFVKQISALPWVTVGEDVIKDLIKDVKGYNAQIRKVSQFQQEQAKMEHVALKQEKKRLKEQEKIRLREEKIKLKLQEKSEKSEQSVVGSITQQSESEQSSDEEEKKVQKQTKQQKNDIEQKQKKESLTRTVENQYQNLPGLQFTSDVKSNNVHKQISGEIPLVHKRQAEQEEKLRLLQEKLDKKTKKYKGLIQQIQQEHSQFSEAVKEKLDNKKQQEDFIQKTIQEKMREQKYGMLTQSVLSRNII